MKKNIKKIVFPKIDDTKVQSLLIDNDSLMYITYPESAQEITNLIIKQLPETKNVKDCVITDITAGVGGNVLNFSLIFNYVNAIEIDKIRYEYLKNNIKIYNYLNINCYHSDFTQLLFESDNLKQDIIFFDPPWGGRSYKSHEKIRLNINLLGIEDIVIKFFENNCASIIVIKLPKNYDFEYFNEKLNTYKCINNILSKMSIMIIKKL